ncbi:Uncharacterised protein [Vibrio cholerae]|nr:Uncharacterised protein [Vibrio cholerae]
MAHHLLAVRYACSRYEPIQSAGNGRLVGSSDETLAHLQSESLPMGRQCGLPRVR